jgi:hypothetical protein
MSGGPGHYFKLFFCVKNKSRIRIVNRIYVTQQEQDKLKITVLGFSVLRFTPSRNSLPLQVLHDRIIVVFTGIP